MFRLFRSRKAQIRGIDFSLSIIIFSLTMGQVLLLTNTFIDGNRSQIDFEERLEFVDSLANQVVFNSGYGQGTENWGTIPTSTLIANPNWNLGLSTAGSIDPYKIGRLSNNSISSLEIDYLTAQKGLNLSKNFRLQIVKPINVEITSASDDGASIFINGFVSKSSTPLLGVNLWVYAVDHFGNVFENQTISNSNGQFSVPVAATFTDVDHFTIGIIARYGLNSEATAVLGYPINTNPTKAKISITNSTNIGSGSTVNVTSEMFAVGTPKLIALFAGLPSSPSNSSSVDMGGSGTLWSNSSIGIPPRGSVIFIAYGTNGTLSLATVDFPVSLDGIISNVVQPSKIPTSDSSSRFISITVRGILLDVIITIWE